MFSENLHTHMHTCLVVPQHIDTIVLFKKTICVFSCVYTERCLVVARYVKEQLIDDSALVPSYDGQVVCWV